jgi:hypothetical protein
MARDRAKLNFGSLKNLVEGSGPVPNLFLPISRGKYEFNILPSQEFN